MATKIEWCDETINVVAGCTKISPACDHCFAEKMAYRISQMTTKVKTYDKYSAVIGLDKKWNGHVSLDIDEMDKALKWKKPKRIFIASMGDLFHPAVPFDFSLRVFDVMSRCHQHTFLVLTKRPQRALEFCSHWGLLPYPDMPGITPSGEIWPNNVWAGCTVEDQQRADERIPILQSIPAAVHFISYEPALGPLGLARHFPHAHGKRNDRFWAICGQETGLGARPAKPEWFNSVINQCRSANVPMFVKKAPAGVEIIREFPT